jgi:AraC family cel operon transcriptional repressor
MTISALRPQMRVRWEGNGAVAPGALAFIERAFYRPGFRFPVHDHDYAELFYVEQGSGVHALAGGEHELHVGDLVFIHPDVVHALGAPASGSLIFINMVVPRALHRSLERRYFPDGDWPWSHRVRPQVHRLRGLDLEVFLAGYARLERAGACASRIAVESFLIDLLQRVSSVAEQREPLPARLADAVRSLDDPAHLGDGVADLARRAGCSREHFTRRVQRHLGMSAMDLLNDRRLTHAARMLQGGDEPIVAIALRCGFPHLGHFYRMFGRRFGITPKRFRGRVRRVFV